MFNARPGPWRWPVAYALLAASLSSGMGSALLAQSPANPPTQTNGVGSNFELVFWQSIMASEDKAQFEAYLAQYPAGTFSALARAKITALTKEGAPQADVRTATPPPAPVAPAPGAPVVAASGQAPATSGGLAPFPAMAAVPAPAPPPAPHVAAPVPAAPAPALASPPPAPATVVAAPLAPAPAVPGAQPAIATSAPAAVMQPAVAMSTPAAPVAPAGAALLARLAAYSAQGAPAPVAAAAPAPAAPAPAVAAPPAAVAPAAPALLTRPELAAVPTIELPAQFCSAEERNRFHEANYVPTVKIADSNNTAAITYLDQLQAQYDLRVKDRDINGANAIARDAGAFRPLADQAYASRSALLGLFDRMMAVPVKPCASAAK